MATKADKLKKMTRAMITPIKPMIYMDKHSSRIRPVDMQQDNKGNYPSRPCPDCEMCPCACVDQMSRKIYMENNNKFYVCVWL